MTISDIPLILLSFLVCCLVTVIAVLAGFYSYKLLMAEWFFSSLWSGLGINTKFYSVILILSSIFPFVIFPGSAYVLRSNIYSLPYSDDVTFWIYWIYSLFPFSCIIFLSIFLVFRQARFNRFQLKLADLIAAEPLVDILKCSFINTPHDRSEVELTVRISNVNPIVPEFVFETRFAEDDRFFKFYGEADYSGWVRAILENGTWKFPDSKASGIESEAGIVINYRVRYGRWLEAKPENYPTKFRFVLAARNHMTGNWEHFFYRDIGWHPMTGHAP